MKLKEHSIIPNKGNYMLYFPFEGELMSITSDAKDVVQNLNSYLKKDNNSANNFIQQLKEKNLFKEDNEIELKKSYKKFKPTKLVLFPTSDCNLECVYCFANSGREKRYMDFDLAKASIDHIFKNVVEKEKKVLSVGFHGGGEPTYAWDTLEKSVEYSKKLAKKAKKDYQFKISTNGVISDYKRNYLIDNFEDVQISFDGTKEFQNKQRPKFCDKNKETFDEVYKTIQLFEKKEKPYFVRSTITQNSVDSLIKIIDFLANNTSRKEIHMEPLFQAERCEETNYKPVNSHKFLKKIIETREYAKEKGIEVYCSGNNILPVKKYFCGAAGENFFVTVEGKVSSCIEVSLKSDSLSDVFFYGEYNRKNNKFVIDDKKLDYLKNRTIDKIDGCYDCFAKYACAGECLSHSARFSGDIYKSGKNIKCVINRGLLKNELKNALEVKNE